ncbi:MAG: hybrid sensor histidine kinase/response regulator [Methylophagaceae bacterium]
MKNLFVIRSNEFSLETYAQGIDFIYQNFPKLALSMAFLPIVMALLLWGKVENITLFSWMLYALSIGVARYWLAKRYFQASPSPLETLRWGKYITITSFASGLSYALSAILFFDSSSPSIQLFLFVFIFGIVNGSAFVSSHWVVSFYVFMFSTLSITALYLLTLGDPAYTAIALLCIIDILICFVIGKRTNHSVLSSIQLRFENAELVRQLTVSSKKAEEANNRKTRFLASASHDLRQPIHALGLFSEALSTEKLSSKGHNTLSFLKQSVTSLSKLLDSLLDISRLDAGIITPSIGAVDLSQLMQNLSGDFKVECQSKGLKWRVRCQQAWVKSDSILLENILRNLLSNAVRYTDKGGILFNCRQRKEEVWIEIWDTGIGISTKEQEQVFDEFYQINNAERDRQQGLGLGLAIVQKQAQLLGHDLSLVSRLGKGTRFRLKLQSTPPSGPSIQANVIISKQLTDRHILIIDDDDAILEGMKITLEAWGCQVFTASNLDEATVVCNQTTPNVIISDFRLRDHVTGIDVVQQLRTQLKQTIPALLITGDTAPDRLQQAQQSDLILLHKPVQPAKLRAALNLL